jgi:hypothetical protein
MLYMGIGHPRVIDLGTHFPSYMSVFAGVMLTAWLQKLWEGREGWFYSAFRLLRSMYPVLLFGYFYSSNYAFNRVLVPNWQDPFFYKIDEAIFGYLPSLVWGQKYSHWAVSELFHLAYFCYYPMIFGLPLYLYLKNRNAFAELIFAVTFTFYLSYFIYSLLPTIGGRYFPEALELTKVYRAGPSPHHGLYLQHYASLGRRFSQFSCGGHDRTHHRGAEIYQGDGLCVCGDILFLGAVNRLLPLSLVYRCRRRYLFGDRRLLFGRLAENKAIAGGEQQLMKRSILIILAVGIASLAAQQAALPITQYDYAIPENNVSPIAIGMGGLNLTYSGDPYCSYSNPALLAEVEQSSLVTSFRLANDEEMSILEATSLSNTLKDKQFKYFSLSTKKAAFTYQPMSRVNISEIIAENGVNYNLYHDFMLDKVQLSIAAKDEERSALSAGLNLKYLSGRLVYLKERRIGSTTFTREAFIDDKVRGFSTDLGFTLDRETFKFGLTAYDFFSRLYWKTIPPNPSSPGWARSRVGGR